MNKSWINYLKGVRAVTTKIWGQEEYQDYEIKVEHIRLEIVTWKLEKLVGKKMRVNAIRKKKALITTFEKKGTQIEIILFYSLNYKPVTADQQIFAYSWCNHLVVTPSSWKIILKLGERMTEGMVCFKASLTLEFSDNLR